MLGAVAPLVVAPTLVKWLLVDHAWLATIPECPRYGEAAYPVGTGKMLLDWLVHVCHRL